MGVIILLILILVGGIVIYLSLDMKGSIKKTKEIDYKNTDFFYELSKLDIENEKILKLKKDISKYIVGSDNLINSIIVSILSDGHILVEGVPGLAKTKTILVFSKMLGLNFQRVQFTPDMLPSDIVGGEIYNKNTGKFEILKGPIFTNLLLADEINRATPKVQSALLEAMQEKTVTIGKETFPLDNPFFVMATQNPLEQEGTFPLPEAQLDRFLFKVEVNYPSFDDELRILDTFNLDIENIEQILSKEELKQMKGEIKNVEVPENIKKYIIQLVEATRREDEDLQIGASTRGIIAIKQASMVVSYLRGNTQVDYEDVKSVTLLVLKHRVKLSNKALSNKKNIEEVLINKLIKVKDFSL